MRVGVNTGEVVVCSIRKDALHTDYVPVGHSTNLAARMEQLAAPVSAGALLGHQKEVSLLAPNRAGDDPLPFQRSNVFRAKP
jgi:class 3 adenylate cyclase